MSNILVCEVSELSQKLSPCFPLCKAVRGLAGLMPSQLAEMALLVLASLCSFSCACGLKDSPRGQRRASKGSVSPATETNENHFYPFLSDSLDGLNDRVKAPERS